MNRYLVLPFGWLSSSSLSACPVCGKQQPKGFAGITHGTGPESVVDYWILYGAITIVVLTLILLIWYLLTPETHAARQLKSPFQTDWQYE